MRFCQIMILVTLVLQFFVGLWSDFHGSKEKEPHGFGGAITTIVVTAMLVWIYFTAGAFSKLF